MAVLRNILSVSLILVPSLAMAGPPPAKHVVHIGPKPGAGATAVKRVAHVAPPARCMSLGSPTDGKLVNGCHLPDAPYMRVTPVYSHDDNRWALDSLVSLVDRAAKAVRKQHPDAVLSVGHFSKHNGGEIDRHASHESGRDADLGFYVKSSTGKALYADHFVPFVADGTAPTWPGAHFDDAKNWSLVSAIAGDGQAHVTYIFVATPIRARLLAYAQKIGAPENIRNRAAQLMTQPHGSLPHDDHFHVRIACPSGMDKCVELPRKKSTTAIAQHKPTQATKPIAKPSAPPPPPAPSKPKPPEHHEASIPSLQEEVPGLDAAVIPRPIVLPSQPKPGAPIPQETPAPTPPKADQPIDDPDGILENKQ